MAGIDADVAFNGETYSFASTGGVATPSMAIRDDGLGARRFSENHETFTSDGTRVSRGTFLQGFSSDEHTSELQSLMRNSYAVFCLKKTSGHSTHFPDHSTLCTRLNAGCPARMHALRALRTAAAHIEHTGK